MKHLKLIIPSIDIKDGRTVRVVQGIPDINSKEYGSDPVEMAMIWRAENAKCIHLVDFDSAQKHSHQNFSIIEEICNSVIIPVEMGGGISSYEDAQQLFELGITRLVIGSLGIEKPVLFNKIFDRYGCKRIVSALDIIDYKIVLRGKKKLTSINYLEYAKSLRNLGIERFVVTDVKSNGMLQGPNTEYSNNVAKETGAKVTLSGGVSDYHDIRKVQEECEINVDSIIIGRALYENKFPCQKIWRFAESGLF